MRALKKNEKIAIWIALPAVLLLLTLAVFKTELPQNIPTPAREDTTAPQENDGLTIITSQTGTGKTAVAGNLVSLHYTGSFENGEVFDSSLDRGIPFTFILGAGQVIRGWDAGVEGMKVGEKRHLIIAPEYAYGESGVKDPTTGAFLIPPHTTLLFDIELIEVNEIQQ